MPHLVIALADPDESVRAHAAESLGKLGDKSAVPSLGQVLDDSDALWLVRCLAAEALGKLGDNSAVPSLVKALPDSLWPVRSAAAEALGKLGAESAVPYLVKALADPDESVRANAAEALSKLGHKGPVPLLSKSLADSDKDMPSVAQPSATTGHLIQGSAGRDVVDIEKGASTAEKPFSICPYCGVELKLPKTPRFCPFCREKLAAEG